MSKEIGLEDIAGQIANAKTLGLTFTEHDFMALTVADGWLFSKATMAEEQGKQYGQLIAKAWSDEGFKGGGDRGGREHAGEGLSGHTPQTRR